MAEFGELPELFDHIDDLGFYQFWYDHESLQFQIASKSLPLHSPNLERETYFPTSIAFCSNELKLHTTWLSQTGKPLSTPHFYSWLKLYGSASELMRAKTVMHETFEELKGMKLQDSKPNSRRITSPFGFEANFIREGHINLQVLGNCACLGPDPEGHLVNWYDWPTGFAEYTIHNSEFPEQRLSLLAGLGHLGARAQGLI